MQYINISCSPGQHIDSIVYAKLGMPQGWQAGSYETRGAGWFCFGPQPPPAGHCEKDISASVLAMCRGRSACTVPATRDAYGSDPCDKRQKGPGPGFQVAVRVSCTRPPDAFEGAVDEHAEDSKSWAVPFSGPIFRMAVTIPPASTGSVHVPLYGAPAGRANITESGLLVWGGGKFFPGSPGLQNGAFDGRFVVFETVSWLYNFVVTLF